MFGTLQADDTGRDAMNSKDLMLGVLLVKEKMLTKDQLKKVLLKQGEIRRFGRHQLIGEVITRLGFMDEPAVAAAIEMQEKLNMQAADHTPLGLLLIDRGLINPSQIFDALVEQQFSETRLGEMLIAKGMVTEEQLLPLLAIQATERRTAAEVRANAPPPKSEFLILDAGGSGTMTALPPNVPPPAMLAPLPMDDDDGFIIFDMC